MVEQSLVALTGTVFSQTALLVGVLYYFGWIRTQATYAYFGVSTQFLDLSTTDVVLRSLDVAPQLVVVAAFVALATSAARGWLVRAALRSAAAPRLPSLLTVLGIVLFGYAIAAVLRPDLIPTGTIAPPISLICGALALIFVSQLGGASAPSLVRSGALLVLVVIGVLWLIALYAQYVGVGRAQQIAATLHEQDSVTVYSKERLAIGGNGIRSQRIAQPGSRYTVQYSGLYLLGHPKGRYLLLPQDWVKGRDSVYVIPDDDSLRIDVTARP